MNTHLVATVIFGLAASLCWGSGDFSGGLASRRAYVGSVVLTDYAVGLVLLVTLALLWREPVPEPSDLLWGGLAGLAGVLGVLAFYSALAKGKMGIVAPVSAVLTVALPVLFSVFTAGLPTLLQLGGFALAGLSIGLIAGPQRAEGSPRGMGLAVLAGCGFGGFFILISQVQPAATFWSLAAARLGCIGVLLVLLRVRQKPLLPPMTVAPLVVLAGVLDAFGNVLFVLAAHSGHLDVAAILSSLYPAATVGLSALVLRERVMRIQAVGILLVLLAVPLISA
jgi:drug/metabolite transporter (DMT)-like permease